MVIGSKELIRDINTSLIIETIIKNAPISRVDISTKTGLTKGTVSTIVQNLLDLDLVLETGFVSNGVGRRRAMLQLNKTCGYCITLDVEKHRIRLMGTDMCGNCHGLNTAQITNNSNIEAETFTLIDNFISSVAKSTYGITGIAIAVDGNIRNNIPFIQSFNSDIITNLANVLSEKYNTPVTFHNNAHLAVLGENVYSMRAKSLAFVTASNHIGMGIIADNRLFCGSNGQACQLGKMIIGSQCKENGILENLVSINSLINKLSSLKGQPMKFDDFVQLFKANDSDAKEIAEDFIYYLSLAITNIITMYDPEIVVINSPFTICFNEIFLRLKLSLGNNKSILYRSMLKDEAALYGGAVANITNFLKIDNFTPALCYFKHMQIL
ncbi:MAG: ROK family transcriptional regulator [Lachnospiraceae bacterium]|nr:ROK family transcriptional regulator [Lachnospiraceae bacterium]